MYNNLETYTIDAPESDYLYTDVSQIPGAGFGLFTAIRIFKNEIIAVFEGERISIAEQKKRRAAKADAYFIDLPSGRVLDSMYSECFAKYANDACGITPSKFKNNATITLDANDQPCLLATRTIHVREEIFCDYGRNYWKQEGVPKICIT